MSIIMKSLIIWIQNQVDLYYFSFIQFKLKFILISFNLVENNQKL